MGIRSSGPKSIIQPMGIARGRPGGLNNNASKETTCGAVVVVDKVSSVPDHLNTDGLLRFLRFIPVLPQTCTYSQHLNARPNSRFGPCMRSLSVISRAHPNHSHISQNFATPAFYPHMQIGKVDVSFSVLCVCVFVCLFVCTVTDFSAEDKASGVKFCTTVHRPPRQEISHFCEICSHRSPKSDKSASAPPPPRRSRRLVFGSPNT